MADADDSYDLDDIDGFVEPLRAGADLVMGNRFQGGIAPGAMPPLHRYLGNPVLSLVGRLFFRIPVRRLPLRDARLPPGADPARSGCAPTAWSSPARWWSGARCTDCDRRGADHAAPRRPEPAAAPADLA